MRAAGSLRQDARHAVRALGRNPGLATTARRTLALGTGANTAVLTVFDAVLLRPLPYRAPDRLATTGKLSAPELADLAAMTHAFSGMGGSALQRVDLLAGGRPIPETASMASGRLFETLGVGLAASLAAARGMSSLLVAVRPADPATFAAVSAVLAAAALAACWILARLAARIDPATTLRAE